MSELTIQKFIAAANRYDTQAILDFFAPNAVIDDVSVGVKFEHHAGIERYFTNYFIAYHTITQLLSTEHATDDTTLARIDFTGDFGHETGGLRMRFNEAGLITHIDAFLD
jgi:ketosteroid isomerase-like protein